jgi:hypothetical protein
MKKITKYIEKLNYYVLKDGIWQRVYKHKRDFPVLYTHIEGHFYLRYFDKTVDKDLSNISLDEYRYNYPEELI